MTTTAGTEQTWTTDQLREEFDVLGFAYGMVVVRRKSDGVRGSLQFNHGSPTSPRLYRDFQEG